MLQLQNFGKNSVAKDDPHIEDNENRCTQPIIEQPSKNKFPLFSKKVLLYSVVSVLVVISIIIGVVIYTTTPIYRFRSALEDSQFETADELYQQSASDSAFVEKAGKIAEEMAEDAVKSYQAQEKTFKKTLDILEYSSGYSDSGKIDALTEKVRSIEESRKNFKRAVSADEQQDYPTAIEYYQMVIEDDEENYAAAKDGIERISTLLCEQSISTAKQQLAEKNVLAAFSTLCSIEESWRTSALNEEMETIRPQAIGQVTEDAESFFTQGDYKAAYQFLMNLPEELSGESEIVKIKEQATTSLQQQAETLRSAGDYDSAIDLLSDENGTLLSKEFLDERNSIQIEKNISTLKAEKGNLTIDYDEIDKIYTISNNTSMSLVNSRVSSVVPRMAITEDGSSFALQFFVFNDSWIFTDEITIDCDGTQFELETALDNRQREVYWGGIVEYYDYFDNNRGIFQGQNDTNFANLIAIAESIANSEKTIVRFSGDEGRKDITISDAQKRAIAGMAEIYTILVDSPGLFQYLT